MHDRAAEYVSRYGSEKRLSVLEIGSRYINGGVRKYWPEAEYLGCDIVSGHGVDLVCDASLHKFGKLFDVVVTTEVLEHTQDWRQIVANGVEHLKPGGRIIITCAGPGRPVHSAVGSKIRPDEWYGNVCPAELYDELLQCGVVVDSLELFKTDTRASGVRAAE